MTRQSAPVVVLVAPQLAENIGTAARAMANFGLSELRLVAPRDGWPNHRARAAASRADAVIDGARVYTGIEEAVGDLGFVYAATARARDIAKPVVGPGDAARRARALSAAGVRVGVLFGRERAGLTNEEVSLADDILTFPVNPEFPSLNIAQAVLLLAYEWRLAAEKEAGAGLLFDDPIEAPAAKRDLIGMFEHLEGALDTAGFFRPPERRPSMVRALRAMLQRARLSEQEVRTFRGVIAAFQRRPTRPRKLPYGGTTSERSGGDP